MRKYQNLLVLIMTILLITVFLVIMSQQIDIYRNYEAENIIDNMLQNIEDLESYKFTGSIKLNETIATDSGSNTTITESAQSCTVDLENKKLILNNTYTTAEIAEQLWITYIDGMIMYIGIEENGTVNWSSYNISKYNPFPEYNEFNIMSILGALKPNFNDTYIESFENHSIDRLDDEIIEGSDCFLVQVTSIYKNESFGTFEDSNYTSESIEYFWIEKKSNHLIKYESFTTSKSSGWEFFFANNENKTQIDTNEMSIVFYDYNVPVTIEVPPEAKDV